MNRPLDPDQRTPRGSLPRHHETITAATLRASDEDREQTATRLRDAAAVGRLLADELDERLAQAFSAKTYGELDALVSDLPSSMARHRRRPIDLVPRRAVALAAAVLIALVLVAGALGLGVRRSSAAAPDQPRSAAVSHVGPT